MSFTMKPSARGAKNPDSSDPAQLTCNIVYWTCNEEQHAGPEWRRLYKTLISLKKGFESTVDNPILFGVRGLRDLYIYQKKDVDGTDDDDSAVDPFTDDRYILDKEPNLSGRERRMINNLLFESYSMLSGTNHLRDMYRVRNFLASNGRVYMRIFINIDFLDKCLSRPGCVSLSPYVIDSAMKDWGTEIKSFGDRSHIYPLMKTSNIPVAKISQITEGLEWVDCMQSTKTPFEYQKANVDWMNNLERGADLGFNKIYYLDKRGYLLLQLDKVSSNPNLKGKYHTPYMLYQDTNSNILLSEESLWKLQGANNVSSLRGGILCDEVGLGKTLSMVGIMLKNPMLPNRFSRPTPRQTLKVPTIVPKIIQGPAPLVQLKPIAIQPVVKPPLVPVPITVPIAIKVKDTDDGTGASTGSSTSTSTGSSSATSKESDKLPRSSATLVLAPSRLCQQWEDEIAMYVKPEHNMRVLKITTIVQLRHYTLRDIQNADVVIVSYPFLANKNYQNQTDILLDKIHWHRVILDEGHEVLYPTHRRIQERTISKTILSLKSTYKWCCTGDPLAQMETSFDGILMFLADIEYGNTQHGLLLNADKQQVHDLFDKYFRRNTKKSTKDMIVIPSIQERVQFLDFSKTERAIYDNAHKDDVKRRLQLCTNILISDKDSDIIGGKVVTMENINESMKEHYVRESAKIETSIENAIKAHDEWMAEYPKIIADIDQRMAVYGQMMMQGQQLSQLQVDDYNDLKERKPKMKTRKKYREKTIIERLSNLRAELRNAQEQVRIFTQLNSSSLDGKPCAVCAADINESNPLVLNPCGHINCGECAGLLFNNRTVSFCPYCRKNMPQSSLQTVTTSKKKKKDASKDQNPILNRWGTKMAYLTEYLHKVLSGNNDNRVILFSQWNRMLHMVGMVLDEAKIHHVFCRGNVHTITKSISRFKRDPSIRVIMLSSESCSSGNNLTEASHIVLLDTPNMDREAALAIENQAVGRAVRLGQARPVEVTRMIIKDTIEETYFYRNHPTAKDSPIPVSGHKTPVQQPAIKASKSVAVSS